MPGPFAYESNVLFIREKLVPEHIGTTEWVKILEGWQETGKGGSLLAYLATAWRDEGTLLDMLAESLHVPVCRDPIFLERNQLDATGDMFSRHGFAVLGNAAQKQLITGGSKWNPNLGKFLGTRAKDWQWVLVPPLRTGARDINTNQGIASVAAETEIADWLGNLINGLWAAGVTDIHFETADNVLVVRTHEPAGMRTTGEWTDGRSPAVIRLLCRWAGVADWDQQSYLDGTLVPPGRNPSARLRFSLIPTVTGSSIVLRAPAPALYARKLGDLGLPDELQRILMDRIHHDSGLILCTGSTGSGKTTTLYGILNELQGDNLKILTIEDPVEQTIPHAVQSSLDPANGWTFEKAVHAFLRQDPDVIMIGEIRDAVSAAAACRAALTGHCVLSSMHAASPQLAIQRLLNWKIPESILRDSLKLVIGQRLVTSGNLRLAKPSFAFQEYAEEREKTTSGALP